MKTIDIFFRGNGFDDFLCIDMCRQWQLHQDTVNAVVVVQRMHPSQQLGFGHGGIMFFQ